MRAQAGVAALNADLLGRAGGGQSELRQVVDDRRVEVQGALLNLLKHQHRGHDLGDRTEQERGVAAHRRGGCDVGQAVRHHRLLTGVVDPATTPGTWVLRQKAATRWLRFMPLILEPCPWGKVKRRRRDSTQPSGGFQVSG